MPIYYDRMGLSIEEILRFAAVSVLSCLLIGKLFYDSFSTGLILIIPSLLILPKYRRSIIKKHKEELMTEFRDMLYSISSSVAAGLSMLQSMEEALSFWSSFYGGKDYIICELSYMTNRIRAGNESDTDVLYDFAERSGLSDVTDFVNVYGACRESGGNLEQAIIRATQIIGDKINLKRELRMKVSEKMFEARIIAVFPVLLVMLIRVMSPEYLSAFTASGAGKAIMTFALLLIGTAILMIEKINDIDV